ncbi:MAG: hypothetical protein ACM3SW_06910, partial [Actinomycetota bacterium]
DARTQDISRQQGGEVEKPCKGHPFDVVVIDQNVSPAVKKRFFFLLREHCVSAKILERHRL